MDLNDNSIDCYMVMITRKAVKGQSSGEFLQGNI